MDRGHYELLCREILGVNVFTGTKKGTTKRSAKWAEVVGNLSNVEAVCILKWTTGQYVTGIICYHAT